MSNKDYYIPFSRNNAANNVETERRSLSASRNCWNNGSSLMSKNEYYNRPSNLRMDESPPDQNRWNNSERIDNSDPISKNEYYDPFADDGSDEQSRDSFRRDETNNERIEKKDYYNKDDGVRSDQVYNSTKRWDGSERNEKNYSVLENDPVSENYSMSKNDFYDPFVAVTIKNDYYNELDAIRSDEHSLIKNRRKETYYECEDRNEVGRLSPESSKLDAGRSDQLYSWKDSNERRDSKSNSEYYNKVSGGRTGDHSFGDNRRKKSERNDRSELRRSPPKSSARVGRSQFSRSSQKIDKTKANPSGSNDAPNKGKKLGRWASSFNFPLPKEGEPGGLDDLRRIGMNGATVKRYINLLHDGVKPDEAKELAYKLHAENAQKRGAIKRGAETSLSPLEPLTKQRKGETTELDISSKITYEANEVAIIPSDYPTNLLTENELKAIEKALVDQIENAKTYNSIRFNGIKYEKGMIILNCYCNFTVAWVKMIAPRIKVWKDVKLITKVGNEIPRTRIISFILPQSAAMDDKHLVKLLNVQNLEMNIQKSWKILKTQRNRGSVEFYAQVNDRSCELIAKQKHVLFFRFATVPVDGVKIINSNESSSSVTHPKPETVSQDIVKTQDKVNTIDGKVGMKKVESDRKVQTKSIAVDKPLSLDTVKAQEKVISLEEKVAVDKVVTDSVTQDETLAADKEIIELSVPESLKKNIKAEKQ